MRSPHQPETRDGQYSAAKHNRSTVRRKMVREVAVMVGEVRPVTCYAYNRKDVENGWMVLTPALAVLSPRQYV